MAKRKKVVTQEDEVLKPVEELAEDEKPPIDLDFFAKMPEDVFRYIFESAVEKTFGKQS